MQKIRGFALKLARSYCPCYTSVLRRYLVCKELSSDLCHIIKNKQKLINTSRSLWILGWCTAWSWFFPTIGYTNLLKMLTLFNQFLWRSLPNTILSRQHAINNPVWHWLPRYNFLMQYLSYFVVEYKCHQSIVLIHNIVNFTISHRQIYVQ